MKAARSAEPGALSAELEALTLRAIRDEHRDLNGSLFGWSLSCPAFALTDSALYLGKWRGDTKTLELSRQLVLGQGWAAVVEVLKHEMAHQYVHEVLGKHDESAHGPAFRRVCAERNIDARASGNPVAAAGDDRSGEAHAALGKIAHLLNLAKSPNEHEAQAAMAAAQRLMLKYNIEACLKDVQRRYCFRHVGVPSGRVYEAQRILALILSEHFFVETIWVPVWRPLEGKRGSVIEICGTPENVDMAEYAHAFLSHTSERLWREHKAEHQLRSNRDRRAFVAGVMSGFRDKLKAEHQRQATEGLIWRGDPTLARYLKERHPRSHWTRYATTQNSAAHDHGHRAGSRIVLHRAMGQATSERGRLLPR
jgi:uncharacterized protein DUF2786/SprT-like family protein